MKDNVFRLSENTWRSRAEMAEFLGVSERTVTRRVKRGEIIRRERPGGNFYRLNETDRDSETRHETGQDETSSKPLGNQKKTTQAPATRDTRQDGTGHETGQSKMVSVSLREWGDLRERVGRLEAERDAARNHARQEKEARQKAEGFRGKYYLEAGRRELAEERLEDKTEQLEHLKSENERLRKQVRNAQHKKSVSWNPFSK